MQALAAAFHPPTRVHSRHQSVHQGAQLSRVSVQGPRGIRPMSVLMKLGKRVPVQRALCPFISSPGSPLHG